MEAATVDLAIEMALVELKTSKEKVNVEILSNSGLFQKAKVKVTVIEDFAEQLVEFVNGTLSHMGLSSKAVAEDKDDTIFVNISGDDSNAIIGYRGETLDALQYLVLTYLNEKKGNNKKVIVDCEGYREKRKETLTDLALKLAEKANRLGRKIALEPMNSFERRIIHGALADSAIADTNSEGEEPNRYIVIIPTACELKSDKPIINGQNDNHGKKNQRHSNNKQKGNRQKKHNSNSDEVEERNVYRGYFTDSEFVKPQAQSQPPKFKSFGGKKKF